jgi:hypothetical protein
VAFIGWADEGLCPQPAFGPRHFACSGLIAAGATWTIASSEIPSDLRSGSFYSLSAAPFSTEPGASDDPISAILCDWLAAGLVGDADVYRRFKDAFDFGIESALEFTGIPASRMYGEPIEVIVRRDCDLGEGNRASSDYVAISGADLTIDEGVGGAGVSPTTGLLPILVADSTQLGSSFIHVHNAGTECVGTELWFASFDQCLRRTICDLTISVAPGATQTVDVSTCIEPGAQGIGWVRATQRVSILVDTAGTTTIPSYTHDSRGERGLLANGILRDAFDRTTLIHLSNHDGDVAAQVEVSFRRGGEIDASLKVWLCPKGGTTVDPRSVPELPDGWQGQVQVLSLPRAATHWRPGWSPISGIVTVVEHPTPSQSIPIRYTRLEALDSPLIDRAAPQHELFLPIARSR